jgi:NAD(P)-dependent dehydrogenase (short-subunit alcohol dehydrogenase family)
MADVTPTVLVTGATDGLGRALARRLGAGGARLLLHGRSRDRLDAAVAEIGGDPRPQAFVADLSDLAQVRDLAASVLGATDRLDVLVSNAGIGGRDADGRGRRATSRDGYELVFAVNYLAGFLLTLELLPLLRRTRSARVVNVASLGLAPLDFSDLMLEREYSERRAYGQSKLAQIMSGFTLAERVPPAEVTVNSLHPATLMPTKLVLDWFGYSVDSLESGVEATYRLAVDASFAGVTGGFFNGTREAQADPQAYDSAARRELWERSLQLVRHDDVE